MNQTSTTFKEKADNSVSKQFTPKKETVAILRYFARTYRPKQVHFMTQQVVIH